VRTITEGMVAGVLGFIDELRLERLFDALVEGSAL
jgi:hypothetical protein